MAAAGGAGGHPAGCGCGCHEEVEADGDSLFPLVDTEHVTALNEEVEGSAKTVFRPLDERTDTSASLCSNEGDPELIVHVPFTAAVKIKSICVVGAAGAAHPTAAHLFINRDDVDFDNGHELKPTQTLALNEDVEGVIDYPLRSSKFGSVHSLTIFFTATAGGEDTAARMHYIGFKGVNMKHKRAVVTAVYETRPTASDVRARGDAHSASMTGTT